MVFPVDGGVAATSATAAAAAGASRVVALPDGGAVVIGRGSGPGQKGFYAAELTAAGALDPSFGSGGIAHVTVDSPPAVPLQVLRQPDGKLIVIVSGRQTTAFSFGQLVVVRLDADGSLDPSFGSQGIVSAPVAPTCGSCTTAGLAPDGDIVLTGEGGLLSAALGGDPSAPTAWVVASLTPSGALDPGFGAGGLETIAATGAGGYDVAVLPSGEVMTLGVADSSATGSVALLSLLGPNGGADRGFNAGAAVALPPASGASALLVEPNGSAIVGGAGALFGFTPAGRPDPGFGENGVAQLGALPSPLQLLPAAGGDVLAVGRLHGAANTLSAVRVTAAGSVDGTLGGPTGIRFKPRFGGGRASLPATADRRPVPALAQDSFAAHSVAARPDGSYVAVGGVDVVAPAPSGRDRSVSDFAVAALTPGFTPLSGFGGPPRPLRLALALPAQSASADAARHAISVRLDVSARGLARVRIKASGHVLAAGVLPIFGSGPRILPVALTAYGASVLRGRGAIRVTASVTARDLVIQGGRASASGTIT